MVIQVLIGLDSIDTQLALNGRSSKYIGIISFVQCVVGNMLNDGSCFFVVDKGASLDNEFFRIVLELVEDKLFDTRQNLDDGFSGQTRGIHQFADKIILHTAIRNDLITSTICLGSGLGKGRARARDQSFLGCNVIHATRFYLEVDLGHTQFCIQRNNKVLFVVRCPPPAK